MISIFQIFCLFVVRIECKKKMEEIVMRTTTLLDLNDDCLREICSYFDLSQLCGFADVCERFRGIAQSHFQSLKLMEITKNEWNELRIRDVFRLMRNFGKSIRSLVEMEHYGKSELLIETIVRYCGDTLHTLTLKYFKIGEETGEKMRPLLLRLHKFGLIDCNCAESFWKMLPTCLSELRELQMKSIVDDNCDLIRAYPKLVSFSIGYLSESQFEVFLKKNQQLKSLELDSRCEGDVFFNLITKHLPTIESLNLFVPGRRSAKWNDAEVQNLIALKKLVIRGDSFFFGDTLRRMAAAHIPLETFALFHNRYHKHLLSAIAQFETIKTLQLVDLQSIKSWHLTDILKQLRGLTELYLQSTSPFWRLWNEIKVLEFIEVAKKLQKLYYFEDRCNWRIDERIYLKIVDIVRNREDSNHLEIEMVHDCAPNDVPEETRNENNHLVSFETRKPDQIIQFGYGDSDEEIDEYDSDSSDTDHDFSYDYDSEFDSD